MHFYRRLNHELQIVGALWHKWCSPIPLISQHVVCRLMESTGRPSNCVCEQDGAISKKSWKSFTMTLAHLAQVTIRWTPTDSTDSR